MTRETPPLNRRTHSTKLTSNKKRTESSKRWLQRQLNDPYVTAAKAKGYRSRAAFKLVQIDEQFRLLKPGQRIVDLGAAPGGWMQVAGEKVGLAKGKGMVIGIDLLPIEPLPGTTFIEGDFTEEETYEQLRALVTAPLDLVLSDMAANTSGYQKTDHLRIVALAELALDFALNTLAPGGAFVVKLFQGGETRDLLDIMKKAFRSVKHAKPAASRQDSSEVYVVAMGFRGLPGGLADRK